MRAQCLCAKTQFEVTLKNHNVHACHCTMCCRQSSGVLMTVDIENEINFIEHKYLSVFRSSEWGERGFCNACGTTLFWRTHDQSYTNINVFALNDLSEDLVMDLEIYIESKPGFYAFSNPTQKMTGMEVEALFKP